MRKLSKKFRYLLEYFVFLALLKILRLLSIDNSASICSAIARRVGPLLGVTKIARNNLRSALGNDIDEERLIDALWDNFGRFIGEFPHSIDLGKDEVTKRIKIEGLEHIREFQQTGRPFIVCTGHFANWDLLLLAIEKIYPKFGIVYRKANNPYVDKVILDARTKDNIHLIAKGRGGAKDLVKSFKSGHSIAMLVDQKMNDGIEVPFFGRPAMTSHGIAKLALQFDYPIVPCQMVRTKGSYFKIIVHPPLCFEKTDNTDEDCYRIMLEINRILEHWIVQNPEQWFWFHNRWGKLHHSYD